MVRAADVLAEAGRVPELSGESAVTPDWGMVAKRIREEATDDWDDAVAVERLEDAGARFVRGEAALAGPRRVQVGDDEYDARRGVVLNTGTEPVNEMSGSLRSCTIASARLGWSVRKSEKIPV